MSLRATYRLQLHGDFGFAQAAAQVPYLHDLGISHLYLSPVAQARAGSTHGYDVTDPTRLSRALGGEAGWAQLVEAVRRHGMGLIVDFVPNHMAASMENPWWADVLRHGRNSRHAAAFDIDWRDGKVTLPLLSEPFERALAGIRLVERDGRPAIDCGVALPVSDAGLAYLKGRPMALSAADMRALLDLQHYRLIDWHEAPHQINYRRFFDINDLVGLNATDAAVFGLLHGLLHRLVVEGAVQGVRLDHVDGLRDPMAYCRQLNVLLPGTPLWVEKILDAGEVLPRFPGVIGTTGYETVNLLSRAMLDREGLTLLDALWRDICGGCDAQAMRREAKRQILRELFPGAFAGLVEHLAALTGSGTAEMAPALEAYLIALPVYRSYVDADGVSAADRRLIDVTIKAARHTEPAIPSAAFDSLHRALTLGLSAAPAAQLDFVARLQQLSGPLMAKAVEDTLFYRDFRLLALNEVGGDPESAALTSEQFHRAVHQRQASQPGGLNATATHDTKRGEDARLRLTSLAMLAEDWSAAVRTWLNQDSTVSRPHRTMLYQALLGAWPLDGPGDDFASRAKAFATKALREGKQASSWLAPDAAYEKAAHDWIDARLGDVEFRAAFEKLATRAALLGAVGSLAQLMLKATLPGLPDFYQGCELWDLSFVDPDNRRPVDYVERRRRLASLPAHPDWRGLCRDWRDGTVKLALTRKLLALRQAHPALFAGGDYRPLPCLGRDGQAILAFSRSIQDHTAVIIVCRACDTGSEGGRRWPRWSDLEAIVELDRPMSFRDALTGGLVYHRQLSVAELFGVLPGVVLMGD